MNTKNQKGFNSKRKSISRFVLIWQDGSFSLGEDFSIAKSYCKRKKLILGLLKLRNRNNRRESKSSIQRLLQEILAE